MPEITAAMVRELRDRTGVAMMDCKSALAETGGDMEKAVDLLRKKGQAKQDKLASREAKEGRVAVVVRPDGKAGAIASINCNTDFTAKSAPVVQLADLACQLLLQNASTELASHPQVQSKITEAAQQTGENVRIGGTATVQAPANGRVAAYLYAISSKIGVLMAFGGNPSEELITDIGGHIAFARPLGLTRDEVPADVVAKEREIAVEQAKATGKPQNIAEKIAEGKLNAFYGERVLLDQEFFNAGKFKGSIAQYLKQNNVTLEKYVRVEVGQ